MMSGIRASLNYLSGFRPSVESNFAFGLFLLYYAGTSIREHRSSPLLIFKSCFNNTRLGTTTLASFCMFQFIDVCSCVLVAPVRRTTMTILSLRISLDSGSRNPNILEAQTPDT